MMSIVDSLVKREKTFRKAVGIVDSKKITITLNWEYRNPGWWVNAIADDNEDSSYHGITWFGKFFANRYFNYLMKTYDLKEENRT